MLRYNGTIMCRNMEDVKFLLEQANVNLEAIELHCSLDEKSLDWLDPYWGTYIWSLKAEDVK